MSAVASSSPIEFLASELAETSRLTRELTAAATKAIAALAEQQVSMPERDALNRLMIALQAQDRVEQRLARLEAYARELAPFAAPVAKDALRQALVLDELVASFERHHGEARDGHIASDVELF